MMTTKVLYAALKSRCCSLISTVKRWIGLDGDTNTVTVVERVATTVTVMAPSVETALEDVEAALKAVQPYTGVITAAVPMAGVALIVTTKVVEEAEVIVKKVEHAAEVALAAAHDMHALENAAKAAASTPTAY